MFKLYRGVIMKANDLKIEDNIEPNHYKLNIKGIDIEVRDIMKCVMSKEEYKGFLYGNIIKYVLRTKYKNGLEDIKKAKQYVEWLIEEKENIDN